MMLVDHQVVVPALRARLLTASDLGASDGVLGVTAGVTPALGGESLVVVGAELHAVGGPGVEVALGGEGGRADDGRLVDLGVLPDVVGGAVAGDGADLGALSGSSTVGGVLLDVVLDKRVLGPAVDGDEDGTGLGLGGAGEVDLAGGASLPALADDEVTSVGEGDGVAVVGGLEVDVARGLVVLVVVLALDEVGSVVELEVGEVSDGSRGSEGSTGYGERGSDGGEGNHFDCWCWKK
jgi:hypothetical protein